MSNIENVRPPEETVTSPNPAQPTPKQNLQNLEAVRDLFAAAHDMIAQAQHPGHLSAKVDQVMHFLKFHYSDFKSRAEGLAKQIENEAKAELSKVDVEAAKAATKAVLAPETPKA
jgi:hypothetical protein